MKTILKRIGVCITGFIFGVVLTSLIIFVIDRAAVSKEIDSSPRYYVSLEVQNWNEPFTMYLGRNKRYTIVQKLIDRSIMENTSEYKLKNGEKRLIYISNKGNIENISSGNYLVEDIERNKIYLNEDLNELRNQINSRNRVYDISVVDYYEEGYIKEILIEAKEK